MTEARLTEDGSYTLYDSESGECYHSYKGALTESEHVFLAASNFQDILLAAKNQSRALRVVEMGLGTGLNYLLSARAASQAGVRLHYHALENRLLSRASVESLNFEEIPGLSAIHQDYLQLACHSQQLPLGVHRFTTMTGELHIHLGDAQQCVLQDNHFDVCFYDAFSPSVVPELWQQSQLKKFYQCLKPAGYWVSYCAKGVVRRDLISCGFLVERLPGPPGKREMLRATKPSTTQPMPTN